MRASIHRGGDHEPRDSGDRAIARDALTGVDPRCRSALGAGAGAGRRRTDPALLDPLERPGRRLRRPTRYDCERRVSTSEFEYNDRGRGPKIRAHYEFGADGLPSRIDVSGVNYLKAPVDEHLASRSRPGDCGAAAPSTARRRARGFYVSNDGRRRRPRSRRSCGRSPGIPASRCRCCPAARRGSSRSPTRW